MALPPFKNWRLKWKLVIPAGAMAIGMALTLAYLVQVTQRNLVIDQARKTAFSVANQISADRTVYTDAVVSKLQRDGNPATAANLAQYASIKGGIPLPASFVHATSKVVNAKGSHTADLLSLWNLDPTKGPRNAQEREALQELVRDPSGVRGWVADEGTPAARYVQVIADVASVQSCADCHNAHPASTKRDFRVNDVMGGLVISVPLADAFESSARMSTLWTGVLLVLILVLIGVILLIQWRYVTHPLIQLEKAAEQISLGQIDTTIGIDSKDEVGQLAAAFDRMRRGMKKAMERLSRKAAE